MAEGTTSPTAPSATADFDACAAHIRRLWSELEETSRGQHAAVDADGNYAIGKDHKEAMARFKEKFGRDNVTTVYIGRQPGGF